MTDWGSSPKIERATLAGTQRTVLVDLRNTTQYWPNAVIVDYREDRIYWIDAWIDAIESCDLYGKHRRTLTNRIHPSFNMHPFDFTVYDDILYWSEWSFDSIERLNWTTAAYLGGLGILTSDRVFGVALLDDSRQPAIGGKQNQITPASISTTFNMKNKEQVCNKDINRATTIETVEFMIILPFAQTTTWLWWGQTAADSTPLPPHINLRWIQ